jgi:hypothetical protein
VKNGPHCAFAHGAHDLRPPVYDVRELQAMDVNDPSLTKVLAPLADPTTPVGTPGSIEKDRILNEDPKWNGKVFNSMFFTAHHHRGKKLDIAESVQNYFTIPNLK